ncbi:MAG: hypothetical protein PVSMB1_13540 [Gemmatimonadaceae bacterium]
MPFVKGESLRSRLVRGELPVNEVAHILRDISAALAHAHTAPTWPGFSGRHREAVVENLPIELDLPQPELKSDAIRSYDCGAWWLLWWHRAASPAVGDDKKPSASC